MTPEGAVREVLTWLLAHPDLAMALLAVLGGGAPALHRYRRTGQVPLGALPWRAIRRLVYAIRRTHGRYPKPTDRIRTVDLEPATVRERLGRQSYELEWPLSYHYASEDINARRYLLDESREYPHRQLHIRAWDRGDRTEIYAHEEPSAIHHPRAHIRSTDMTDATAWVVDRIDNANGLDPRGFANHQQQAATDTDP